MVYLLPDIGKSRSSSTPFVYCFIFWFRLWLEYVFGDMLLYFSRLSSHIAVISFRNDHISPSLFLFNMNSCYLLNIRRRTSLHSFTSSWVNEERRQYFELHIIFAAISSSCIVFKMAHSNSFHSVVFVESILVFELYFPFPDCIYSVASFLFKFIIYRLPSLSPKLWYFGICGH